MKIHLSLVLVFASALVLESAPLFQHSDAALKNWQSKSNTELSSTDHNSFQIEVETSEFNYGWVHHPFTGSLIPLSGIAGITGRYKAPSGTSGSLAAYIITGSTQANYHHSAIGSLRESNDEWIPFYLPFHSFSSGGKTLNVKEITDKSRLQISISSIASPSVKLEIDQLAYVPSDQAVEMQSQVERGKYQRMLLSPEQSRNSPHPRLLLTPDRLDRIREKIETVPEVKRVYELFIAYAEQTLKDHNAEAPFKDMISGFDPKASPQQKHKQRGRIEGMLVRAVRPIEMLAAAYMLTGDERYGKHAARALVNAARSVDHNNATLNEGFYYTRTFYVRALAFGYDWLWDLLTPAERREVQSTLLGFVCSIHTASWSASWGNRPLKRVWNWDPGLVSAAGVGMLALEGETTTAEETIIFELRRHLRDYLTLGIDPDGCGHEGPSYLGYGIGAGPEFAECLRSQGRGDLFTDTNWKKIAPWLAAEILPDHTRWNNLSDCGHGMAMSSALSYTYGRVAELAGSADSVSNTRLPAPATQIIPVDFLAQFSEKPGDRRISYNSHASILGWLWKDGLSQKIDSTLISWQLAFIIFYEPCPAAIPVEKVLPPAFHFRGRGMTVVRSGFETNDIHLAVEAGPHVAGHDQADKGSFTLYGYGADLAIDSGYGNDGEALKSGSSFAHNMVLINGRGQPMSWHNQSSGKITGFHHSALLDWIRVDALDAWNFQLNAAMEKQPAAEPVEKANRSFIFVRKSETSPPYLVVMDDIRKDGKPADYSWLWHIPSNRKFLKLADRWMCVPLIQQNMDVLTTPEDKNSGSARFILTAIENGTYRLGGLVRAGSEPVSKSDSFFVSVNGAKSIGWHLNCRGEFTWTGFMPEDAPQYHQFNLKAGEKLEIVVSTRERGAELAKLALMPVTEPNDLNRHTEDKFIVQTAAQAELLKAPLIRKTIAFNHSNGSLAVFPVTTSAEQYKTALYETSREGSHPRLEHTVHDIEPRFLMVLIPFTPEMKLPEVKACQLTRGVSAIVKWPGCKDQISFSSGDGIAGDKIESDASATFVRQEDSRVIDWAMLDGTVLKACGQDLVSGSQSRTAIDSTHR